MKKYEDKVSPYPTLAHAIAEHVQRDPNAIAFELLQNADSRSQLTYGALNEQALKIAAFLRSKVQKGSRVLLPTNNELSFQATMLGCMYAGCISVPVPVPRIKPKLPDLGLGRFLAIINQCKAAMVLIDEDHMKMFDALAPHVRSFFGATLIESCQGAMRLAADASFQLELPEPDQVAFLQYTSGSTSQPKGVMLTHRCIVNNQRSIQANYGLSSENTIVSWLPLYHDMGLASGFFMSAYLGTKSVLMPPLLFVTNPYRWLEEIGKYACAVSGAPNFAYAHCVDRITDSQLASLNLNSWKVAFCGAEPIRPETVNAFCQKFQMTGFDRQSFFPSYGLAEATLFVSSKRAGELPQQRTFCQTTLSTHEAKVADSTFDGKTVTLTSCGHTGQGISVAILDPASHAVLADGQIGEVAVSSDSAGIGYWDDSESTDRTFNHVISLAGDDRQFFLTGDLGFVLEGELFVSGRMKELIIVSGVNYYPQDLEFTAQLQHDAFRNCKASAFAIDEDKNLNLVMVMEAAASRMPVDHHQLASQIRQAVRLEHQLCMGEIIFVAPGKIPKTTSGKVQRTKCRELYQQNHFGKRPVNDLVEMGQQ
jgi:acyl-CoA synthetase (AMP-forming)/AMP-acid ligase II